MPSLSFPSPFSSHSLSLSLTGVRFPPLPPLLCRRFSCGYMQRFSCALSLPCWSSWRWQERLAGRKPWQHSLCTPLPSPPPFRLPVQAWVPSAGRPTASLCGCVSMPHNRRTCLANPEGHRPHDRVSPLCGGRRSLQSPPLASQRFPLGSVSHLHLFLVVCPHGLLCLDTLTTRSCEVTTFQLLL